MTSMPAQWHLKNIFTILQKVRKLFAKNSSKLSSNSVRGYIQLSSLCKMKLNYEILFNRVQLESENYEIFNRVPSTKLKIAKFSINFPLQSENCKIFNTVPSEK